MMSLRHVRQVAFCKRISLISVPAILGAASGIWLVAEAVIPEVAQAETSRISISLNYEPGESYTTLLRRAEATARVLTQRTFDGNSAIANVSFMMMGENSGAVAPLFTMEVSRDQWQSRPDPQRWATYFTTAEVLLGLDGSTDTAQPAASAAPLPASATQTPTAATPAPVQPATAEPSTAAQGSGAAPETVTNPNPLQINLPAAPGGQLGLPRSVLR